MWVDYVKSIMNVQTCYISDTRTLSCKLGWNGVHSKFLCYTIGGLTDPTNVSQNQQESCTTEYSWKYTLLAGLIFATEQKSSAFKYSNYIGKTLQTYWLIDLLCWRQVLISIIMYGSMKTSLTTGQTRWIRPEIFLFCLVLNCQKMNFNGCWVLICICVNLNIYLFIGILIVYFFVYIHYNSI